MLRASRTDPVALLAGEGVTLDSQVFAAQLRRKRKKDPRPGSALSRRVCVPRQPSPQIPGAAVLCLFASAASEARVSALSSIVGGAFSPPKKVMHTGFSGFFKAGRLPGWDRSGFMPVPRLTLEGRKALGAC
jgi:hypothetical protein